MWPGEVTLSRKLCRLLTVKIPLRKDLVPRFFANIDRVTVFQPSRSMPTNTLFHNFGIVLSYFQAQCVDKELFFNVQFT